MDIRIPTSNHTDIAFCSSGSGFSFHFRKLEWEIIRQQYLDATGSITNTIIVSNTAGSSGGGIYQVGGSTLSNDYNNVWGNAGGNYDPPTITGTHDISVDPLFLSPGVDYHLDPSSLCVDAATGGGAPDHDFDGDFRPQYNGYDIGFDEAFVNTPPVAVDDVYTTTEDHPLVVVAPGVLANDTDPDDQLLTAFSDTDVATGTLVLSTDGAFTYSPPVDFNGVVTFTYITHDGVDPSNIATVTITVEPVNDPPVAVDDVYTTTEDQTLLVVAPGVLENDTDPEGEALAAILDADVTTGTLTLSADGAFTYTPPVDFSGAITFAYVAHDGTDPSNIATVSIIVEPGSDPPVAADDVYTTTKDQTLVVVAPGVLENDTDPDDDLLTAILDTDVATGTLALSADGAFIYISPVDFSGVVTFTYFAHDGIAPSNIATVTITVEPGPTYHQYLPLISKSD